MHPLIAAHSTYHSRHSGRITIFVVLFLVSSAISGHAQLPKNIEIGPFIGGSYYLGDLNPDVHFKNTQLAYGIIARYNLDDRWSGKFAVSRGTVKGNSSGTSFLPGRDLSFTSPITDASVMVEFNFFPYFTGSKWNWITPYIYAGVGWFFFQPSANGVRLQPLGTEGQNIRYEGRKPYSTNGVNFPFGLGVKVSISRKIGITAYWEMHKTFTDYIDDVSNTYYLDGSAINPNDINGIMSDPTRNHTAGMQRGNPKNYDWYSFFGITASYMIDLKGTRKCRDNKHF